MYQVKQLLTTNNAKTIKGEILGYQTHILYMSPYTHNSKGINACSHASKGCAESCLVGSGRGRFPVVKKGRLAKTEYFLANRIEFLNQLFNEITTIVRRSNGKSIPVIRLNGTSDWVYEKYRIFDNNTKNLFEMFPNVQFYDYTKNHTRFKKTLPSNYHLTFSRSEDNHDMTIALLIKGYNVAIVFKKVPDFYMGFKVINGDENDLRFLDEKNVIVGLKYKNLTSEGVDNTLGLKSGFVVDVGTEFKKVA